MLTCSPRRLTKAQLEPRHVDLEPTETAVMQEAVPHAAFEDPTASPNALPRESIELRTLVFY